MEPCKYCVFHSKEWHLLVSIGYVTHIIENFNGQRLAVMVYNRDRNGRYM